MKNKIHLIFPIFLLLNLFQFLMGEDSQYPIGEPGTKLSYSIQNTHLPKSVVKTIVLTLGSIETQNGVNYQWLQMIATKNNRQSFSTWILSSEYPSSSRKIAQENMLRYIIRKGNSNPIEFSDQNRKNPILPTTGAWEYLLPRSSQSENPIASKSEKISMLGHEYILLSSSTERLVKLPKSIHQIELTPDLIIGVPHNQKIKDEARRWDETDYEYIQLTRANYMEMMDHGMNYFNVNTKQVKWIENENVYFWGIGGKDISYPETLYRSNYIGPVIFFDEPMVVTRDHSMRPMFKKDPESRKTVTVDDFFEAFKKIYHKKKYVHGPTSLINGLSKRDDVDVGSMNFLQQNIYSWETMPASALYQLSEGNTSPPNAIVFETPGRFGSKRILPELNMCFDCQIPVDNPNNLISMMNGFMRGAARMTDKEWGMSIYGQVDRSDASWFLTHAYDQGATIFMYWDSYQMAAVPYLEYLTMSKHLREHSQRHPNRNLDKLKKAAEVAILIPPGYNMGHVKMGIGHISGLGELNRERLNTKGVKHGTVMSNFYVEVERCLRLGIEFDAFWDLEGFDFSHYSEIVNIRKNGKVEVTAKGQTIMLDSARILNRANGVSPHLSTNIKGGNTHSTGLISVTANIKKSSAPVYFTRGVNDEGKNINQYVLWELFGPGDEDYTAFWDERFNYTVTEKKNSVEVEFRFTVNQPGEYRLRVATTDLAGKSAVVWTNLTIK